MIKNNGIRVKALYRFLSWSSKNTKGMAQRVGVEFLFEETKIATHNFGLNSFRFAAEPLAYSIKTK